MAENDKPIMGTKRYVNGRSIEDETQPTNQLKVLDQVANKIASVVEMNTDAVADAAREGVRKGIVDAMRNSNQEILPLKSLKSEEAKIKPVKGKDIYESPALESSFLKISKHPKNEKKLEAQDRKRTAALEHIKGNAKESTQKQIKLESHHTARSVAGVHKVLEDNLGGNPLGRVNKNINRSNKGLSELQKKMNMQIDVSNAARLAAARTQSVIKNLIPVEQESQRLLQNIQKTEDNQYNTLEEIKGFLSKGALLPNIRPVADKKNEENQPARMSSFEKTDRIEQLFRRRKNIGEKFHDFFIGRDNYVERYKKSFEQNQKILEENLRNQNKTISGIDKLGLSFVSLGGIFSSLVGGVSILSSAILPVGIAVGLAYGSFRYLGENLDRGVELFKSFGNLFGSVIKLIVPLSKIFAGLLVSLDFGLKIIGGIIIETVIPLINNLSKIVDSLTGFLNVLVDGLVNIGLIFGSGDFNKIMATITIEFNKIGFYFQKFVTDLVVGIGTFIGDAVWGILDSLIRNFGGKGWLDANSDDGSIRGVFVRFINNIGKWYQDTVTNISNSINNSIRNTWNGFVTWITSIDLLGGATNAVMSIKDNFIGWFNKTKDDFVAWIPTLNPVPIIQDSINVMIGEVTNIFGGLATKIGEFLLTLIPFDSISTNLTEISGSVPTFISGLWSNINNFLGTLNPFTLVKDNLDKMVSSPGDFFTKLKDDVIGFIAEYNAFSLISKGIKAMIEAITGIIPTPQQIGDWLLGTVYPLTPDIFKPFLVDQIKNLRSNPEKDKQDVPGQSNIERNQVPIVVKPVSIVDTQTINNVNAPNTLVPSAKSVANDVINGTANATYSDAMSMSGLIVNNNTVNNNNQSTNSGNSGAISMPPRNTSMPPQSVFDKILMGN